MITACTRCALSSSAVPHTVRANVQYLLLRERRTSGWADASRPFLNHLKYTVEIVRLKGQGVINQTYTLYLVFSPRQCSVLTSLSQSAHVLYMSAFTLCLHLARSPGIHWKTGEIYVLFLSNVFLQGRVRATWWFRIWGRETLGPWAQFVMCPQARGGAVELSCRIRHLNPLIGLSSF